MRNKQYTNTKVSEKPKLKAAAEKEKAVFFQKVSERHATQVVPLDVLKRVHL